MKSICKHCGEEIDRQWAGAPWVHVSPDASHTPESESVTLTTKGEAPYTPAILMGDEAEVMLDSIYVTKLYHGAYERNAPGHCSEYFFKPPHLDPIQVVGPFESLQHLSDWGNYFGYPLPPAVNPVPPLSSSQQAAKDLREGMEDSPRVIKSRLKDSSSICSKVMRLRVNHLVTQLHGLAREVGHWVDLKTGQEIIAEESHPTLVELVTCQKLLLVHSEVSEAVEGYRRNQMDDKLTHRSMIECELADAVIRCMDLAGFLGLDLGGAIAEKSAYNSTRADHSIEQRKKPGGKKF